MELYTFAPRTNPGTILYTLAPRTNHGTILYTLAPRTNPGIILYTLAPRTNPGTILYTLAPKTNPVTILYFFQKLTTRTKNCSIKQHIMIFFDFFKNGSAQALFKINNHYERSIFQFFRNMSICVSKVAPRTTEYCPVVGFFWNCKNWLIYDQKTIIFGVLWQSPYFANNLLNF